jgi:hypothetical protein
MAQEARTGVTQQPIWFRYGSRLDAVFATADEKIPALGEFVHAIAPDLKGRMCQMIITSELPIKS